MGVKPEGRGLYQSTVSTFAMIGPSPLVRLAKYVLNIN